MSENCDIRIDETICTSAGRVIEVTYTYMETQNNVDTKHYDVSVKRSDYETFSRNTNKPALSYDDFLKVLRPFMMGKHAAEDIPVAFRILDTDRSGTIDIGELAAYMPVIVPNANPYMLLHHVQKVDQNSDYKLNLAEFSDLINKGIGRDLTLGRI